MKTLKAIPVFFIYMLMLSCATMNVDLTKMSPEDVGALAMTVYNARYADHMNRSTNLSMSDQEKIDLQNLKDTLVNIYPYIITYNIATDGDFTPTMADRQMLLQFIRNYYYKE